MPNENDLKKEHRKKCCEPIQHFKEYLNPSTLREVSLVYALKARERGVVIRAKQFLCDNCRKAIDKSDCLSTSKEDNLELTPNEAKAPQVCSQDNLLSPKSEAKVNLSQLRVPSQDEKKTVSKKGRIQEALRKLNAHSDVIMKDICLIYDLNPEDLLMVKSMLRSTTICYLKLRKDS